MKIINNIILCVIFSVFVIGQSFAQTNDTIEYEYDVSMFRVLWRDYIDNKENRKEKRECYARYTELFLQTIYSQMTAPVGYIGYYWNRKKITAKIEELYKQNNLENIENIGNDIINDVICKDSIKKQLGSFYYNLWLYGDTDNPIYTGGVPDDYKPNMSMFLRRWFYCGLRNPRWNATYINNYSANIVNINTVYDTRINISTHNYGTGDTRLGTILRWCVDNDGKWWFFYENTKRTKGNKGKLFYFGTVGLGQKADGIYNKHNTKKGRFEFSLNRTVTIDK